MDYIVNSLNIRNFSLCKHERKLHVPREDYCHWDLGICRAGKSDGRDSAFLLKLFLLHQTHGRKRRRMGAFEFLSFCGFCCPSPLKGVVSSPLGSPRLIQRLRCLTAERCDAPVPRGRVHECRSPLLQQSPPAPNGGEISVWSKTFVCFWDRLPQLRPAWRTSPHVASQFEIPSLFHPWGTGNNTNIVAWSWMRVTLIFRNPARI